MGCEKVKRKLSAFLDNELREEETTETEKPLSLCSLCAKEAEILSETWKFIGELEPISPSPDFWDNLSQKILPQEDLSSYGFFSRLVQVPLSAAISFILIIGLSMGIYLGNTFYLNVSETVLKNPAKNTSELSYMTSFDALPSDSIGSVYVELALQRGTNNEK